MSGKSAKKRREQASAAPRGGGEVASPAEAIKGDEATAEASPAWIDSADPRKRKLGQLVLAGVWLYVAALWLLALDQIFHWGIFGPTPPSLP